MQFYLYICITCIQNKTSTATYLCIPECVVEGKILPKERKGFPEFGNSQDHVI